MVPALFYSNHPSFSKSVSIFWYIQKAPWVITHFLLYALLVYLLLFWGVACSDGSTSKGEEVLKSQCNTEKPDWIDTNQSSKKDAQRFKGTGEGENLQVARQDAEKDLLSKISAYIMSDVYVEISQYLSKEQINDEEQFTKQQLEEFIQFKSSARLQNFKVQDEFCTTSEEQGKTIFSVNVLCDYANADLKTSQKLWEDYFAGQAKQALSHYEEAKRAVTGSQIGRALELLGLAQQQLLLVGFSNFTFNHPEITDTYALKTKIRLFIEEIIENVQITKVSGDRQAGLINGSLPEPLVVKATYQEGSTGRPVPIDKLRLIFSSPDSNGKLSPDNNTNSQGVAECKITELNHQADSNPVQVTVQIGPVSTSFDLSRLNVTFNYRVGGRGMLVVTYIEYTNEQKGAPTRIDKDIFTAEIMNLLQQKGMETISEYKPTSKQEFMGYHTNDLKAINQLKQKTQATDILTCYVACRTTGKGQSIVSGSAPKVFFMTEVQLQTAIGSDSTVTNSLRINEGDTKSFMAEENGGVSPDKESMGMNRSIQSALQELIKKMERELEV